VPAGPTVPGKVKVQFPWDRIAVASVFALGVLLIVVAAANEKWLKGSSGNWFNRGSRQIITAGKDAQPKTPKLFEASAKGTHAPPAAGEGTPPQVSEIAITKITDAGPGAGPESAATADAEPADAEPSTEANPEADATKDVKLKGKNIGEN
jgi:hypothetical protein